MSKLGDKITAAGPKRIARVDVTELVPEWADLLEGSRLFLRDLTGAERDEYECSRVRLSYDREGNLVRTPNLANLRARLVSLALVDQHGERVFPDAARLGQSVDGQILDRLFERAQEVCGLVRKEGDSLKNGPGTASSTGSPSASAGAASSGGCGTSAAES